MGISHPTINTRDVAAFVPFRRGLGCGSTIPPLHVLVHRLMGRSMGLGYEHPVRPHIRSYLSIGTYHETAGKCTRRFGLVSLS